MKKNIYLSLDSWYPQVAGPNVVVTNYYKYLKQSGNNCQLIVPSYGKKNDLIADENTGISPLRSKGMYVPFGGFYNALPNTDANLRRQFEQMPPSILHCHSPFNLGKFYAETGKKYDAPSILTFHTKFKDEFIRITKSQAITSFMMKRIMKVINAQDYVWTVSDRTVDTLREYGYKGNVTVIRNGTDMTLPANPEELVARVNEEYNLNDCENVILFVGRIVANKNLQLVFNALKLVKERSGIPFKMLVVGTGDDIENHKKMAEELNLQREVVFVGEITDREYLKAFYLRADLFAFPSTFDTASLCPLEAAAFSLPTLLIKDCPTSETVEDNVSGFCEVEDARAWADKIIEIFSDKQNLVNVGGGRVSKFTVLGRTLCAKRKATTTQYCQDESSRVYQSVNFSYAFKCRDVKTDIVFVCGILYLFCMLRIAAAKRGQI